MTILTQPIETEEILADALFEDMCEAGFLSQSSATELMNSLNQFCAALRQDSSADYWTNLRKHWAFDAVVPMNAANLCPEPMPLLEFANRLRLTYNQDVSQQGRTVFGKPGRYILGIRNARRVLGQQFGLTTDDARKDFAILRNTTEANNVVSMGYNRWSADGLDEVLIWDQNHPTNRGSWHLHAKWDGQRMRTRPLFRVVEFPLSSTLGADEITREITRRITPRTRFISFTQISNGNGMRIPDKTIRELWTFIQNRDIHFHLDGAMSWGVVPVDFAGPKCHSFSASAHKWFLGPKETGILYMSREKVPHFMPRMYGYDYKIVDPPWDKVGATAMDRFELIGQRDDIQIITLAATQIMWHAIGIKRSQDRIADLGRCLHKKLLKNWDVITPAPTDGPGDVQTTSPIIRVRAGRRPDARKPSLYEYLHRHGIAGSGGNIPKQGTSPKEDIRLCPTIYNLEKHLDKAIELMDTWRDLP